MKEVGKALGTAATWAGVAGCAYLFHSFGILNGTGAGWMFFAGLIVTLGIWNI